MYHICIALLLLFMTSVESIVKSSTGSNILFQASPQPNPDELEVSVYGDIDGIPEKIEYWPNALVFFKFESTEPIGNDIKSLVWSAMEEFHKNTCIRFEETEEQTYSVSIKIKTEKTKQLDCSSSVGRNKNSFISLGKDCLNKGVIIHHLMHTLGFLHENNRADTNVEIHRHDDIGQRVELSSFDINEIRLRYNCKEPYLPVIIHTSTTTKMSIPYACTKSNVGALYPHESDCNKFLICDYGGRIHELVCPVNLEFDPKHSVCNYTEGRCSVG